MDKYFVSQIGFSLLTVGFCMYMIITNPDPSQISIFLPIICNVIGVWTPNASTIKRTFIQGSNEEVLPLINKTGYEAV